MIRALTVPFAPGWTVIVSTPMPRASSTDSQVNNAVGRADPIAIARNPCTLDAVPARYLSGWLGLAGLSEYELRRTDEDEFRECAQIVHSLQ